MPKTSLSETDTTRLKFLGICLRLAREGLSLSYRDLAKSTGVSPSQLLRMECGEFDFGVASLMRVSETLAVPIGMLLESSLFGTRWTGNLEDDPNFHEAAGLHTNERAVYLTRASALRELVIQVYDIAAALILSSSPNELAAHVPVCFESLRERIRAFAAGLGTDLTYYERAAQLRSLGNQPFSKIAALGLLTPEIISEFFENRSKKQYFVSAVNWAEKVLDSRDALRWPGTEPTKLKAYRSKK